MPGTEINVPTLFPGLFPGKPLEEVVNTFTPRSDQYVISPYIITLSTRRVMRMKRSSTR